jgi:MFS family permease
VQYGTIVLITGSLGVLTGPWLARLIERRGRQDSLLLVPLGVAFALAIVAFGLGIANSYATTLAVAATASFTYSLPQALASSALQIVTPNRMRGLASAIYVFVVSVVGLGAAPTIVALLTDHLFHDEKRVGEALMITCAASALLCAFFLSRALRSYRLMMARG